jgi:hypothetical protein
MTMLYAAKLNEVRDAADKIEDAVKAVQFLIDDEPLVQPPGRRLTELRQVSRELRCTQRRLEALYE